MSALALFARAVAPVLLILAVLVFGVLLGGCAGGLPFLATPGGRALADCGGRAGIHAVQVVAPRVLDVLAGDEPDWRGALGSLFTSLGSSVDCALRHLVWDSLGSVAPGADPAELAVRWQELLEAPDVEVAIGRLYAQAGQPLVSADTPSRRILRRGLTYLREQRTRAERP